MRYARHGWPVFPCEPRGKRPRLAHGLLEGTTDIEEIARWWSVGRDSNIGIVTGPPSGLLVLDVDGDEGIESLNRLEGECGALASSVQVPVPISPHGRQEASRREEAARG